MKSESYFIWARIPQRHASNLRNLQGLNPEALESYNGNCPYEDNTEHGILPRARAEEPPRARAEEAP